MNGFKQSIVIVPTFVLPLLFVTAREPSAPRPHTLSANELAKLRGGDWISNRGCLVPSQ